MVHVDRRPVLFVTIFEAVSFIINFTMKITFIDEKFASSDTFISHDKSVFKYGVETSSMKTIVQLES